MNSTRTSANFMTKAKSANSYNNLHSTSKLIPKMTTYLGCGNNKKASDVNDRVFSSRSVRRPYRCQSITSIYSNKQKPTGFYNTVQHKSSIDLLQRKNRIAVSKRHMKCGARRLKQLS